MHRRVKWAAVVALAASGVGATAVAQTPDEDYAAGAFKRFDARLTGYAEVPSLSSPARGRFHAVVVGRQIRWTLSYRGFQNQVTQSHIHFGQRRTPGGISVWLCGNVANTPAGVQACPQGSADLSGTVDAADVVGPDAQGIGRGETNEVIRAMLAQATYANVHTATYPAGEIRGQIFPRNRRRGDD